MRTLALLAAMTVAGHAEIIRYYLHDATIGNDPNHAVNAAVSGRVDFDTTHNWFLEVTLNFWDNGYGAYTAQPYGSTMYMEGHQGNATSVPLIEIPGEKYGLVTGQLALLQPLSGAPASVSIDLSRSFVHIEECINPGPGGCNSGFRPVDIYFTGGFASTSNPEPSTFILSATCGCLFAWRTIRTRRLLSKRKTEPARTLQDRAWTSPKGIPI